MKKHLLIITPVVLLGFSFWYAPPTFIADESATVSEVLEKLGDDALPHQVDSELEGVSIEIGERLVLTGFAETADGKKIKKQSPHFVCTSCHNIVRDEPDLAVIDLDAKLDYAEANNLPFLQGTALYGAVNRTSFYNGDYFLKYGDLVKPARHNIREAIQLCAVECAQGRALEAWEIESILAYLWTIDLELSDLKLSEEDYAQINAALENETGQAAAIDLIKSKYMQGSPATFLKPPGDRSIGYRETGNPKNGKRIYDLSCKHCHAEERYSFFALDDDKTTFKFLDKHIDRYTRYSIYQVSRYGTSPIPGKEAYMPHYPQEKMSNQQLEDLRVYIEQRAEK